MHPIALRCLEGLKGQDVAWALVLGGYFALHHYLPYRETKDIDSWWAQEASTSEQRSAWAKVQEVFAAIAQEEGLILQERSTVEVQFLTLVDPQGKEVFSFEVAKRDVYLEPPQPSPYPPLQIESLADNLASKMVALVKRRAPRDFLDIYTVVQAGLASVPELWHLFERKRTGISLEAARQMVLHRLLLFEQRQPLEQLPAGEREKRAALRRWYREVFLVPPENHLEGPPEFTP